MTDLEFRFTSKADGLEIQAHVWSGAGDPAGVVVIAHGAAEHARRYARFARELNRAGFEVWGLDHRGHGRSTGPAGLGDSGQAGWTGLIDDVLQLVLRARTARVGRPIALFGHSMGSFAAQQFCLDHSREIDALILSGSTAVDLLRSAPFDPNAAFEPARTPYDWLSRDPAEVDAYIADPWCGFHKVPVFRLLEGIDVERLADPSALEQIRSDLPVLVISGSEDPLHHKGAGLDLLEERWKRAGVRSVDVRRYGGARHELTNEVNRDQVTRDVATWLSSALGGARRATQ